MFVIAYALLSDQHLLNFTPVQRKHLNNMHDGECGVDIGSVRKLESCVSNEEESPLLSFISSISSPTSLLIPQSML